MEEIKLDLKDKKILSVIETDGRLSYAEIGKRVGLSKQLVKYKMDLLEKKDIIQEYYAIVNDSKIGKEIYQVYLQTFDLADSDERKLISELKKQKSVLSYFSSLGKFDLVLAFAVESLVDLEKILQKVLKPIGSKIKKRVVTSEISFSYLPSKVFSDLGKNETSVVFGNSIKFDELDLSIVSELMVSGRVTLVDLAGKLGLTANGIRERLKSLEKRKIIVGYKTKINYEKLGFFHCDIFVWINNLTPELYEKIKDFLAKDGRVESVARFFGYSDLEFRCNIRTIGELYQLKKSLKREFSEVGSVETLFVIRSGISHLRS